MSAHNPQAGPCSGEVSNTFSSQPSDWLASICTQARANRKWTRGDGLSWASNCRLGITSSGLLSTTRSSLSRSSSWPRAATTKPSVEIARISSANGRKRRDMI